MMKVNKKWLVAAIICLALTVGVLAAQKSFSGKTEGVKDAGIATGNQNKCITYDVENEILCIGTHDNQLVAIKDDQELWRTSAVGSYSELVIDEKNNLIYAGNEDGNIYIYQEMDGELKSTINVQRRITSIDLSKDGTKIVAGTTTGSSKSNMLVYNTANGEQLANNKYTVAVTGTKFCEDNETILMVNKRGEVRHVTMAGDVLDSFDTNYAILQMIRQKDVYWIVCKDGSYYSFNEKLEILRTGKIENPVNAIIASIGTDDNNEYVIVGTDEGYFFIVDGQGKQIYFGELSTKITGFKGVGENIYMIGLADMIKLVHVTNLENISTNVKLAQIFKIASAIMIVLLMICILMTIQAVQNRIIKLLKCMWKQRMAYILLIPTFVLIYMFNYRGIGTAFIRAFTNWSKTNTSAAQIDFVGLANFKRMFTEGYFLIGLKNLVLLLVTGIIKVLTVPLLVAWLVYNIGGSKRKYVHRFLFVLPIVVPGVISAMTWQKIYDPSIGLLNEILGALHLENFQRVWLGDAKTAIWAVIFMGFPFVHAMAFLVYYGGFLNIGRDIEESAMIDGATKHDIFWKIQLPLIRPQLSIMITLQIIGTMQDFNSIYILTGGGPGTATYVPALELYLNVAQFGRYGYACALGVILFVFTMAATIISNKLTKERA